MYLKYDFCTYRSYFRYPETIIISSVKQRGNLEKGRGIFVFPSKKLLLIFLLLYHFSLYSQTSLHLHYQPFQPITTKYVLSLWIKWKVLFLNVLIFTDVQTSSISYKQRKDYFYIAKVLSHTIHHPNIHYKTFNS